MKVIFTSISLALLVIALPQVALSDSSEEDTKAVRDLEKKQEEAWNRHDPKAYVSLFSEDGDCVNVVGWRWKGRAEIEKKLTAAYAYVFQESILTVTDVEVKFPTPDVAIAHVRWNMKGARTPHTLPKPQQGIQTQLLQTQDGQIGRASCR